VPGGQWLGEARGHAGPIWCAAVADAGQGEGLSPGLAAPGALTGMLTPLLVPRGGRGRRRLRAAEARAGTPAGADLLIWGIEDKALLPVARAAGRLLRQLGGPGDRRRRSLAGAPADRAREAADRGLSGRASRRRGAACAVRQTRPAATMPRNGRSGCTVEPLRG